MAAEEKEKGKNGAGLDTGEIEKYLEILAKDPDSRVFAPLAEAHRKAGLLDEAIEISREGLKTHANYLGGRVALARALFEKGQFSEARDEIRKVTQAAPDNLMAHKLLARAALQLHNRTEAEKSLRMALLIDPRDQEAVQLLGEMGLSPSGEPAPAAGTDTAEEDTFAFQERVVDAIPPPEGLATEEEIIAPQETLDGLEMEVEEKLPVEGRELEDVPPPAPEEEMTLEAAEEPPGMDLVEEVQESPEEPAPEILEPAETPPPEPEPEDMPVPATIAGEWEFTEDQMEAAAVEEVEESPPAAISEEEESSFEIFTKEPEQEESTPPPPPAAEEDSAPYREISFEPPTEPGEPEPEEPAAGVETSPPPPPEPPPEEPETAEDIMSLEEEIPSFDLTREVGVEEAPAAEAEPEPVEGRGTFDTETLADIFIKQGFYQKAANIYRRMLRENPREMGVRQKLEEVLALEKLESAKSAAAREAQEAAPPPPTETAEPPPPPAAAAEAPPPAAREDPVVDQLRRLLESLRERPR